MSSQKLFTVGPDQFRSNHFQLERCAAFARINTLACIKSANRGWLGASFSCCETLIALYFGMGVKNVVLSKGHAAAMQYACLYGAGYISLSHLLSYKDGPGAAQAHTDRCTPGILMNTGSLGQTLSKTIGMAYAQPTENFWVILGDGELQEGQVWEAVQTLFTYTVVSRRVTVIVDLNQFQTDLPVECVKRIANYRGVFEGFGFIVIEVDGHNANSLVSILQQGLNDKKRTKPLCVLARTMKAGGSDYLHPIHHKGYGKVQPWHGGVPNDELYLKIITEQVKKVNCTQITEEFRIFSKQFTIAPKQKIALSTPNLIPTKRAYGDALGHLLKERTDLYCLDADLLKSCCLESCFGHPRFVEMGISEQDMVSFAGGLALAGKLPVVNTYASFYKRCYEQVYGNAIDGSKIIYAGHYAGLCYHTDGKTHQSFTDMTFMSAIPGMVVCDPVTPLQTRQILKWSLDPNQHKSVYIRLRRRAIHLPEVDAAIAKRHSNMQLAQKPTSFILLQTKQPMHGIFLTTGSIGTRLALDCRLKSARFKGWGICVISIFDGVQPEHLTFFQNLLKNVSVVITIEDDIGVLRTFTHSIIAHLRLPSSPKVISRVVDRFGWSFRTLHACLNFMGFTVESIESMYDQAMANIKKCGMLADCKAAL